MSNFFILLYNSYAFWISKITFKCPKIKIFIYKCRVMFNGIIKQIYTYRNAFFSNELTFQKTKHITNKNFKTNKYKYFLL